MTILLVRHAESAANVDHDVMRDISDPALPLTAKGEEQAVAVGHFLTEFFQANPPKNPVRLWCSPYKRTMETLRLMRTTLTGVSFEKSSRYGSAIFIDERLRERDWGYFLNYLSVQKDPQIAERYPHQVAYLENRMQQELGWYMTRPYGGESAADVALRLRSFQQDLHFDIQRGVTDHIIVMHGMAMAAFTQTFLKLHPDHMPDLMGTGNTGIRALALDPALNRHADFGLIYDPEKNIRSTALAEKPVDWVLPYE